VSADSASSIYSCPGPRIKYLAPSPLPPHPQVRCQPSITIPATSPNAAGSLPVANCVTLSDSRSAGAKWLTSPRLRCRPVARAATVPSRGNPRQGHQPHRPVFAARPRRRGDRISGRPPCLLGVKSGHLGMHAWFRVPSTPKSGHVLSFHGMSVGTRSGCCGGGDAPKLW